MSLTFIEQTKHDFNESHLKYYSILLNFDGVWDFAVTKTPKVGTKITQKGGRVITCDPAKTYPCGAVCRSQSKDCNNPIEGQAKNYAKFLELQGKKEGKIKEDEKKPETTKTTKLKSYNIADVKAGDSIPGLGKVQEIFDNGVRGKQYQINNEYFHERVISGVLDNAYKKTEITPRKLADVVQKFTNDGDIEKASDEQLAEAKKRIDAYFDVKGKTETYVKNLGDGLSSVNEEFKFLYDQGFYKQSDRGFVPKNAYLDSNLQYSRGKIDQELAKRQTAKKPDSKVVEPIKKPQEQTDTKKPDLKVVDDGKGVEPTKVLPKEEPKPLDDKYIPLPDKNQPFSLQESKDFYRSVLEGKVTPEHIKINWERFKDSKSTIEAELNSKTKAELSKMISSMYIRSDDKKADIVKRVLNDIETNFVPGSLAYNPFDKGSKEAALEKGVNEWTQDKIDANSAAFKATQKERIERIAKISEAIKNPQTLEDFETKKQYAKDKTLTPEQQKLYDELVAQKNASQRKSEIEQKSKIEAIQNEGIKMSARQTKHTKTGEDLHVVSLDERVDKETYNKLNERAKKLGGYYSSYNKGGAIPGFQFKDPDKAKEFMSLDELSKGSENLQDKETKGSERLRAVADSLREDANERLNRDRLANTNRRARMAASAEDDARRDLFIADTMQNISDAITNGKAKYLGGINSKAQVEQLESILKQGHYDYARDKSNETNKYQQYQSYKQIAESPITDEAVTRAKFPYPQVRVGSMRDIIKQVKDKPGLKLLAQKMAKKLENFNSRGEYGVKFESEQDIEDLRTFLSKADRHIPKDWDMKEAKAELQGYDRIRRTGITTPEELRTSLREYLGYRGTKQNADPIKKLERDLVGVKIEGYFPTPDTLAFDMVDKLDVKPGQKVLEPSAGKGSLADAVLSKYGADTKIDTIEVNSKLANLLKAKGYDPKQEDFLELKGVRYDRIIMNPPFERGQDMDHVRHAYDLLEPGGKIVAIMGEGGFFRSDSKSVEFRDWLNSRGGTSEKLPEGSFKTSDNPTGVNTRLVIIEKPGRRDFSEFTWSRENIEYFKNFKTPCRTILSY